MTTEPTVAPFWRRPIFYIPAGLLGVFVLAAIFGGDAFGVADTTSTTAVATTTSSSSTTTTAKPTTTSSSTSLATTTTSPTTTTTTKPSTTTTAKPTTTTSKPTTTTTKPTTTTSAQNCHSSYPDFCIPPPPPDLNCPDISQKNFTVLPPDPHGFDRDKDGVGCES